ncbi:hypothetical protein BJ875DRAFT_370716 [Amylocarpus encephaloides]|uniref:Uncharacterized protein n=1 Tax=Amylocarpus encephaloides TaxID=45428 RepID=A0A9P8C887_9HELO|nr:hypothetical protein BJ875DRAFT_370716 [Amylocarpus encephaloides]
MPNFKTLVTLVAVCLFCETASQGNFAPRPNGLANLSHKRDNEVANLTFYTLSFGLPDKAPIYRFESTLIIPNGSPPDKNFQGAVKAVWPGLQNKDLLQNVLTNQKKVASENKNEQWFHLPFFCCHPAGDFKTEVQLYPGDALTSIYVWDIPHNKYLDSWTLVTANAGKDAGAKGFTGGVVYDQKIAGGGEPYNQAILAVELQGLGEWDFGSFTWRNIIVMARTKETKWCTKLNTTNNFKFRTSMPVATTEGELTTCYIATVVFKSPTGK